MGSKANLIRFKAKGMGSKTNLMGFAAKGMGSGTFRMTSQTKGITSGTFLDHRSVPYHLRIGASHVQEPSIALDLLV